MAVRVPIGFRMAGVHCGIKRDPKKRDLGLVVSEKPAVAAGVYTQNLVYAAPVALDRERTPSKRIRVVVVNSGNANACTGPRGLDDARQMARLAADRCGAEEDQCLVLSTGIIGEYLPMDAISRGIEAAGAQLRDDHDALVDAAQGMMTTDTVHKLAGRAVPLGPEEIQVTGMAKGAGMIGPNMATMLGLILTDAALEPEVAQSQLAAAADETFNCISVEGHTSTNDTVLLLANGAARQAPLEGDDLAAFAHALREVCTDLARAIPADGEGATHRITIDVTGCRSRAAARRIAKTIAQSALVKTAVAGADPNWGRIVSAAGYAGVPFDPSGVSLRVNGALLYRDGAPVDFDDRAVSQSIRQNQDTRIELQLAEGDARARFWTSDLTVDYVRINADYHT
jgi:glutamate N-acetyltransferase/amino-acid N-acetyltransferase